MKTIKQIKAKAENLKEKLQGKPIRENFGDEEIRTLEDFIGNFWGYSYFDRAEITQITIGFSHWCITCTGEHKKGEREWKTQNL